MAYLGNKPTAVPLTGADLADSIVTSAKIADGTIVNADINASAGITSTKLSGVNDAKAWVNFNGTGTPAIRASFNVSSITDNGTGDYTVNFTTALTDVNYAVSANAEVVLGVRTVVLQPVSTTYLTSSIRVIAINVGTNGTVDITNANVAIFR